MLLSLLTEFVGTFVFLAVIIKTGDAIAIGIALAAVIFMGGSVSGGHFNPAVSFMMYLHNEVDFKRFIAYIIAQCLGGLCALIYYNVSKGFGSNRVLIDAFRGKK